MPDLIVLRVSQRTFSAITLAMAARATKLQSLGQVDFAHDVWAQQMELWNQRQSSENRDAR